MRTTIITAYSTGVRKCVRKHCLSEFQAFQSVGCVVVEKRCVRFSAPRFPLVLVLPPGTENLLLAGEEVRKPCAGLIPREIVVGFDGFDFERIGNDLP